MKKSLRLFSSLMLAVCMAFVMVIICTTQVKADARYSSTLDDLCFVGQKIEVQVIDNDNHDDITVTSLYTSSSSVLDVSVTNVKGSYGTFYAECKKVGSSKVTIGYRDNKEGKNKTYKQTVIVAPYPKWAKTFTVNGKKVNLSKNKNKFAYTQKFSGKNPKIKLITTGTDDVNFIDYVKAYAYKKGGGKGKRIKLTKKMLKNGTEFDFPSKYAYIEVNVGIYTEYESGDDTQGGHLDYCITIERAGSHKLTYVMNGGENSSSNPYWYDGKVKLKNAKKKGYIFKGWYADKKFKKRVKTVKNQNMKLYAKWKVRKYTISYAGMPEGATNPNKTSYTIKSTFKLKDASCDGYDFEGWYSDKLLTKKITEIEKGSTGKKTIYSKWTPHNDEMSG